MGISTSTGHDKIDAYFIRIACEILTPYISQLCCLSFEYGIFPNCLKIAKIIPVFKNGFKSEVTNDRPISLLSSFSKILESLLHQG